MQDKKIINKIWILNIDDFFIKERAHDALKENSSKYIQILKRGDSAIISPLADSDKDFIQYTAKIKKFTNPDWLLSPESQKPGQSLIEAIAADKNLTDRLKRLCAEGCIMIPLIYTEEFEKLSKEVGNNLFNNSIAVSKANDKLLFKKLCKKFDIDVIKPVMESRADSKTRIFKFLNFDKIYLLRRPFSAGGYANAKGKLADLLKKVHQYHKYGDFFIEPYREIYKTLGTLCMLKDDGIVFAGIDCQLVHKDAWEGCYFPFNKLDKDVLEDVKRKTLQLANYYYEKGVRGQINFDWAIRLKNGQLLVRALECNSRYSGFGLCLRLASNIYDIPKEKLHFYLDTSITLPKKLTTKKVLSQIEKINKSCKFTGGIVLTSPVKNVRAGFCFISENEKHTNELRSKFKKIVLDGI